MKSVQKYSFKKGAASFYIVAFATLILMIIAISFASIIISEVTRTSNDDLAQSAYDSALAGIEDAKLAFSNYKKCLSKEGVEAKEPTEGDQLSCSAIMWYMENPDCYMVSHILGRGKREEVAIQESTVLGNNMQQFYTCVKIYTKLNDHRTTLSPTDQIRVIKAQFSEGTNASDIVTVRLRWFSDANAKNPNFTYTNLKDNGEGGQEVTFPSTGFAIPESQPPVISLALIQTSDSFQMEDFDVTKGEQTNRGMLYFVPTDNIAAAKTNRANNYSAGYDEGQGKNVISKNGFLKSNDKTTRNLPYVVYCPENSGQEFACTVDIMLPEPINGTRSNDNFIFVAGLPYGKPATDISLEFLCEDGKTCSENVIRTTDEDGNIIEETTSTNIATLEGQIEIDSTGRANNLYRRVKSRLQSADAYDLSIMGPLELLGNDKNSPLLSKDFATKCEWNFPNRGC